jgi:hypothetical protein
LAIEIPEGDSDFLYVLLLQESFDILDEVV